MIYTILVMSAPYGTQNAVSAFLFSQALIKSHKHHIDNIFFYCNGVYNANKLLYPPSDEKNLCNSWYKLSKNFSINLNICSNAAYRRGVIDNNIAVDLGFSHGNLHAGFKLTGLGTLIHSILKSDRLLQF